VLSEQTQTGLDQVIDHRLAGFLNDTGNLIELASDLALTVNAHQKDQSSIIFVIRLVVNGLAQRKRLAH
jgi:hypothetical protein